jgi:hypothetical protein
LYITMLVVGCAGVAVGLGLGDRLGAEVAAGAGPILHHEWLAPHFCQPVRDHARGNVEPAAGWSGHDDFDGAVGIAPRRVVLREGLRRRHQRGRRDNEAQNSPHRSASGTANHRDLRLCSGG